MSNFFCEHTETIYMLKNRLHFKRIQTLLVHNSRILWIRNRKVSEYIYLDIYEHKERFSNLQKCTLKRYKRKEVLWREITNPQFITFCPLKQLSVNNVPKFNFYISFSLQKILSFSFYKQVGLQAVIFEFLKISQTFQVTRVIVRAGTLKSSISQNYGIKQKKADWGQKKR